jgi:hypothetical protein
MAEREERECPVCLMEVKDGNSVEVHHKPYVAECCYQHFHVGCLHVWVNMAPVENRTCPACRDKKAMSPFFCSETGMDARRMTWPCEACGRGNKESDAVVCVGRNCLDRYSDEHVWEARAMCYPCYGVTPKTVKRAPDFVCARCSE